jgi:hypothetical protein
MESIQHLVPQDSPLVALAQQGVKAVGRIVAAEPLAGNHHDSAELRNIIDVRRHNRAQTLSPSQHSLAQASTPSGRVTFRTLAPKLRKVDKYD